MDDEALEEHFERLADKRKNGSNYEAVPDADMSTNELTADFKR